MMFSATSSLPSVQPIIQRLSPVNEFIKVDTDEDINVMIPDTGCV